MTVDNTVLFKLSAHTTYLNFSSSANFDGIIVNTENATFVSLKMASGVFTASPFTLSIENADLTMEAWGNDVCTFEVENNIPSATSMVKIYRTGETTLVQMDGGDLGKKDSLASLEGSASGWFWDDGGDITYIKVQCSSHTIAMGFAPMYAVGASVPASLKGRGGESFALDFTITNTGTIVDTYTLASNYTLSKSSVTLDPDANETVQIGGEFPTHTQTLTATVTSQEYADISDSANCTLHLYILPTEGEPIVAMAYAGIVLMAVAIIVIAAVFVLAMVRSDGEGMDPTAVGGMVFIIVALVIGIIILAAFTGI